MDSQYLIIIKKCKKIYRLQSKHPDKKILLVADKGTMGVGSSRMSGVNNVALWIGEKQVSMPIY